MAVVAGVLPIRPRSLLILQVLVLLGAAVLFQSFIVRYVVWAYAHPFNPTDGAAVAFAAMFGWVAGLVWPILPLYTVTRLIRWVIRASIRSLRDGTTI